MILDAKEQWYTLQNLEKVEHMQLLPFAAYALQHVKRSQKFLEV